MAAVWKKIWPRPEHLTAIERAKLKQDGLDLDARIHCLQGLGSTETAIYLEAAQRIMEEEDRRKSGAENRATTFIAAVAALIPLMTWALGSATPSAMCSPGWGCFAWAAIFSMAVLYFVTAAYWALKTLAVANYYVIGVEDIVFIKEKNKNSYKALIQQTLLLARKNRDTINEKLTFIKVAQQRFFNGLAILGLLLMFDPLTRLGLIEASKAQINSWFTSQPADPKRAKTVTSESKLP